jgi:Protein of unknown function (DUF4235)
MLRVLYKPLGMLIGVAGGIAASAVFSRVWTALTGQDEAPDATDRDRGWREVLTAAAVQGAVFGVVKAAVDRGGAAGFQKATGTWPGTDSGASGQG